VRRSTIPLVLLAALSFYAGLGRGAITDSDEGFYAEAAREMVESGDWLTPHYNYEPRFQKPPLYYWLTATLYLVTGPNEVAARFWSAFAGIGLVLVTAACARRWFDDDTGLVAGAITATNFGYFAMARMALPDLPLAFFITLTIYAAFVATLERERHPRRWVLLAALAAALGFLMKGPLAVIIPIGVVLPVVAIERRSLNLRAGDVVLAILLFVAVASPWYVAMWLEHGTPYLEGFFIGDNYERFATTRFNDPRPWWFYLPVIAGGLLPWAALLVLWLAPIGQFLIRRRDIATVELRLILWTALPLIFFTASIGKQPRYILPLLPPLAILLASTLIERTRDWRSLDGTRVRRRLNSGVAGACVLAGLALMLVGGLLFRAAPLFIDVDDSLTKAAAALIGTAGIAVVVVSLTSAWRAAPALLASSAALTFAALPFGIYAAPRDATVRQLADRVKAARASDEVVATFQVFVRNLIFYTGIQQTDLYHDEHLSAWLARTPKALIVIAIEDLERLERERGLKLQRLGEFRYFDDGKIKLRTILWPEPNTDLRRVVLARYAQGQTQN
jgi:4-amino-4-deoxy-L-arabinose transferase-like glycosyltransferase